MMSKSKYNKKRIYTNADGLSKADLAKGEFAEKEQAAFDKHVADTKKKQQESGYHGVVDSTKKIRPGESIESALDRGVPILNESALKSRTPREIWAEGRGRIRPLGMDSSTNQWLLSDEEQRAVEMGYFCEWCLDAQENPGSVQCHWRGKKRGCGGRRSSQVIKLS